MFDPHVNITNSILTAVSRIEAAKELINNSSLLPLYERQFQSDATARQAHFSTAIEGNFLELNEVKRIMGVPETTLKIKNIDGYLETVRDIEGKEIIARKRDIYEVINYRNVVKYIEKLCQEKNENRKFKITEEVIQEIHKILLNNILDERIGEYRDEKALSVNFLTGQKYSFYESVINIPAKMKELLNWLNSVTDEEVHPVLKAGILHLEFVRIHPFVEGNGRVARALATLSLSLDGYDINNYFCLDEYYDSDASEYYSNLQKGFREYSAWLEYFCSGIAVEFNRIKERVLKISKDAKIKERSGKVYINDRQEQIIEWINNYGFFRNQDFEVLFNNISEDTVLRELKVLVDNKILVKKGKTKSARYEFK